VKECVPYERSYNYKNKRFWVGLKERDHVEDLGIDGNISRK
jgi:hypothetical protein